MASSFGSVQNPFMPPGMGLGAQQSLGQAQGLGQLGLDGPPPSLGSAIPQQQVRRKCVCVLLCVCVCVVL